MSSVGDSASRLLRSSAFALACTGLAAAAHALAHGGAPSPAVLVAVTGVLAVLAAPFTGRRRRLPVAVAAVVAVQAGLHTLFSLTPFDRSTDWMRAALAPTLCTHSGTTLSDATLRNLLRVQAPLLSRPPVMPVAPWHGGPLMLGGHLVAAVAISVLLHRCDEALATAAGLMAVTLTAVAGLFGGLVTRPVGNPVWRLPRSPVRTPGRRPRSRLLRHALVLRGPPAVLSAAA